MVDQEVDGEPSHHARRPMNAFLIFCKRHRSVLREKYPNLENRSITKILGEWWAYLDEDEKECYSCLAKEYKDAFLTANPDFKWYKLPAPPLRTLSSRPRDANKSPDHEEVEPERTNNNSTRVNLNRKARPEEPEPSGFTPGKLADEANMGSLSNLLANKTDTQKNPSTSTILNGHRSQNISRANTPEDNISRLQTALSETTRVFEDLDEDTDQVTNQHVIDQVVDKRLNDNEHGSQRNWSDDERTTRSGRSCKGKRYQEFMAVGGLRVNKRQKRDSDRNDDYSASPNWEAGSSRSEDSTYDDKINSHTDTSAESDKIDAADALEPDNNNIKAFTAEDFELQAKIDALPKLCYEKFQEKKRENKRRKKTVNLKPKAINTSYLVNSVRRPWNRRIEAESWRARVIGSQKRKPRKMSITRLEINSTVSCVGHSHYSPEIMLATEAPSTSMQSMEVYRQPAHAHNVDLFALATLAEVAANTSKIENTCLSADQTADSASHV